MNFATIQSAGPACFHSGVVIKGHLDAPNIKGFIKGLFPTLDRLKELYPEPRDGWCALVGDTLPAPLYRASGLRWEPTGTTTGLPAIEADGVSAGLDSIASSVDAVDAKADAIGMRTTTLEQETSRLKTTVSTLGEDLADIDSDLADLETAVSSNTRRIDTLEDTSSGSSGTPSASVHRLAGKRLVVAGNRQCLDGRWQELLCAATGMTTDSTLNASASAYHDAVAGESESLQWRVARLLEENTPRPDIMILIGEPNLSVAGDPYDSPYMMGRLHVLSSAGLTNRSEEHAVEVFRENLESVAGTLPPAHGTRISIPHAKTKGWTVEVTSGASSSGEITVTYHSTSRRIKVRGGQDAQSVAATIMAREWGGYTVEANGKTMLFHAEEDNSGIPTFDCGSTGVTVNVTAAESAFRHTTVTYASHDLSDWLDPAMWVPLRSVSAYSTVKGVVEHIATAWPETEIVWAILPGYSFLRSHHRFLREDGTPDTDAIEDTSITKIEKNLMGEILFSRKIPLLDIREGSGINGSNAFFYFSDWSAIPNESANKKICEGFLKKI